MMDYESAFLGLILAGVLLMITGLGLMMPSAAGPDDSRITFAERRLSLRRRTQRTPMPTSARYIGRTAGPAQRVNAIPPQGDGTKRAIGR
jgi:hypothetical protein